MSYDNLYEMSLLSLSSGSTSSIINFLVHGLMVDSFLSKNITEFWYVCNEEMLAFKDWFGWLISRILITHFQYISKQSFQN